MDDILSLLRHAYYYYAFHLRHFAIDISFFHATFLTFIAMPLRWYFAISPSMIYYHCWWFFAICCRCRHFSASSSPLSPLIFFISAFFFIIDEMLSHCYCHIDGWFRCWDYYWHMRHLLLAIIAAITPLRHCHWCRTYSLYAISLRHWLFAILMLLLRFHFAERFRTLRWIFAMPYAMLLLLPPMPPLFRCLFHFAEPLFRLHYAITPSFAPLLTLISLFSPLPYIDYWHYYYYILSLPLRRLRFRRHWYFCHAPDYFSPAFIFFAADYFFLLFFRHIYADIFLRH